MTIELSADPSGFFRERLVSALGRRNVRVSEGTEVYLVHLLTGFVHVSADEALGQPLVERLAEALEAPGDVERFRRFRALGDNALYVSGFFSDHLDRRGISRDYVVSMGGRAYVAAGDLAERRVGGGAHGLHEVYDELADGFDKLALILDEVRETTSLRTPQDIVRLYERWRRTGSKVLAERLEQEGVFPQEAPKKRLLH
ncbi:MAG: hypothetical protein DRJ42_21965 [Deltaproteobacteria bacterium]|nr:MAG: hypothetical protein DRJ42_21965 [Deltaproteobacteria bacterium]